MNMMTEKHKHYLESVVCKNLINTEEYKEYLMKIPIDLKEAYVRLKYHISTRGHKLPVAIVVETIVRDFVKSGLCIDDLPKETVPKSETRFFFGLRDKKLINFMDGIKDEYRNSPKHELAKILRWYINKHNI